MHYPFGEITGDWSDKPVYIIGGGTSLVGFDFGALGKDCYLIGANKCAWLANCHTMCTIDITFSKRFRNEIEKFVQGGGEAILGLPSSDNSHVPIDGAIYVTRERSDGLSVSRKSVHGVHSGYACLNVAFLKKAKDIRLLGFDMQFADKKHTHWHGTYPWQNPDSHRFYDRWSRNFTSAASILTDNQVAVTNYIGSPASKITEFPTKSLEELM